MKFRTILKGISFILLLLCVQNTASAQSWEFNTPTDSEGWLAYNAGTINENTNVQDDGFFIIDPVGPDPWIENNYLSIDASPVDSIKIRMSSNCNDDIGAIYFSTEESPGFDENKKIGFTVSLGPEWYEYNISVSENPHWEGVVTALRIDPADHGNPSPDDHNDTFGFDYIQVISDGTGYEKDVVSNEIKQQEILNIVNEHRESLPTELVLAMISQEGGRGAFYIDGWNKNNFYSESDGSWAQPTNGDGIMQVTAGSGYKIGPYTHDRNGYDNAITDGTNYLLNNYDNSGTYGSYVYTVLHYNTGPDSLKIYLGRNQGDRKYLSNVATELSDFIPTIYGLQNQDIVDAFNQGQNILDDYLYNKGIKEGEEPSYYEIYQNELDEEIKNIKISSDWEKSSTPTPTSDSSVNTQSAISGTYYIEDERIGQAIAWAEDAIEVKPTYNKRCLKFVQDAYDEETGANTDIDRSGYAKEAAEKLNAAENNEGLPPKGTFVFYDWYGEVDGVYDHWGHVGLSIGNGEIIHNFGTSIKKQDYKSLDQTTLPYIGWAYPPLTPPINRRYPLSGNMYGSDEKDITGTFNSNTSEFTFGSKTVQFGLNTDIPVIGDWDKDGKDEIGVFRPIDDDGKSRFYLVNRDWKDLPYKVGDADKRIDFGSYPMNIPIAGDWDGDGDDDIGGFNPENNVFYLYELNLERSSAESFKDVPFGVTGDIPFIGDWNGDGKDELGVFRSPYPKNPNTSAFYFDLELTGGQHDIGLIGDDGKLQPYEYGNISDYPIIGDWDGNGDDDIGVFRPSDQEFYKDSKIPENPDMSADIAAIISTYGSRDGDDDYNPVLDVNDDGVINISDIVGALKDKIMDLLNLN